MPNKSKKIRLIFLIYWVLLAYIIAALVWWFIALNRQNEQMSLLKMLQVKTTDKNYADQKLKNENDKDRKTTQYIGEGAIFFLLIATGAIFFYKAVNRQLKISMAQQNFMMAITHELKTPIAVATLNLETLQKRKLDETQQQRLIQTTLQETNRLNTLCNNMLLSSQIEAGGYRITFEKMNLSNLVQTCIANFSTRFPHRNIQQEIQEDLFINADNLLMQMAVNNLLDNALKYSPKESPVSVILSQKEKNIELHIKDQGAGIEEKEKVFEKFYRLGNEATKRAKGTGLGLYLTHKIVSAHHGKILIANNTPSGSNFIIQLKHSV